MRSTVLRFIAAVLVLFTGAALAAHEPMNEPAVRVGIVLFDGVQIIDFSGPYEVFGTAGFGVVTLSPDGKPVKTAMGLTVTPDASFADAPPFDVLLVPGGDVADAQKDARVLDFIRKHSASSRYTMSVCTGAFILGSSGLLDGLKATTFTPRIDGLAAKFPRVDVVRDVRWADNGKVITSAGLSSGIDAALHLVARLRGTDFARTTAMHLEYDWKPEGGFVRSRMADRYTPQKLYAQVEWPKDMKGEEIYAFGDERQWRSRIRIASATSAAAFVDRMAAGIQRFGGWTRQGKETRWTSRQEGHEVTLSVATTPGKTAGTFDLEVDVDVGV
ncbi:DJ-1/PfpI family protein [Luteibacter aegosomatis]|uniref:DJ-1/PfpI family protein n=1 Tax=Luteibacter aegosomatis TaxID=2911537 RepID=UPI001FF76AD3|nr:DJ-1/PfpI family protein [Luteibacter aegosomatis]UPG85844.1 DJ-1/PfpI family protein [Luteibacter aegosomatis]